MMCQSSRFSKLMSHKWGFVFEKKMINPLLEDIFFQAHSLILAMLLAEYLLFFPDSLVVIWVKCNGFVMIEMGPTLQEINWTWKFYCRKIKWLLSSWEVELLKPVPLWRKYGLNSLEQLSFYFFKNIFSRLPMHSEGWWVKWWKTQFKNCFSTQFNVVKHTLNK